MAFNFKDTTDDWNKVIDQLYIRQALAHLVDEEGYIKGFFHGAGAQAYGPVPSVPESPFTPSNATKPVYPFSVTAAVNLLAAHGWTVTSAAPTC